MTEIQIFNGAYMTFCLFMALYKAHKNDPCMTTLWCTLAIIMCISLFNS